MTVLGVRIKAPEDRRDADISFEEWLPAGDSLADATAESDSSDLVIETVQVFNDIVKVWLSGGKMGGSYSVNIVATTTQGRIKSACLRVRISGCC